MKLLLKWYPTAKCRGVQHYDWILVANRSFPLGTRCPGDIPRRSPKGPSVWDLQGTFRRLLADQQKNWWFNEKSVFFYAIVLVLHIYYCFLLKKQIFKSSKWGHPRNVYGTQLQDVLGTSTGRRSYVFLKFNSEAY